MKAHLVNEYNTNTMVKVNYECYMVNGVNVNVRKLQPDVATCGYNMKLQLAIANCQPSRSRDHRRPWIAPNIVDPFDRSL